MSFKGREKGGLRLGAGGHPAWVVTVTLSCSLDGVPFLLHDTTLRRTTNVEQVFPELARRPAAMLNWTVLQRLNAGQWFLKVCLYLGLA